MKDTEVTRRGSVLRVESTKCTALSRYTLTADYVTTTDDVTLIFSLTEGKVEMLRKIEREIEML